MTERSVETWMAQRAPYPQELAELVRRLTYRPRWSVRLVDLVRDHVDPADDSSPELSAGLTLVITTRGYDSYHPERGETYGVRHFFPVPPATYNAASWQRWLLERYLDVERHEACEFFQIDGQRPYAPNHGPGHDPYIVHDLPDDIDRRTSFRGELNRLPKCEGDCHDRVPDACVSCESGTDSMCDDCLAYAAEDAGPTTTPDG